MEIRNYEIIYKLLEDIEAAMVGMLAPEFEEVVTGEAEVREIFRVPRVGAIAGCYVLNGQITRGSKVRFLREGVIIWKGEISSLKRFKEDVREVAAGYECGIGLSDFQDLKAGDIIETFDGARDRTRCSSLSRHRRRTFTSVDGSSLLVAALPRGGRPSTWLGRRSATDFGPVIAHVSTDRSSVGRLGRVDLRSLVSLRSSWSRWGGRGMGSR